jgi:hypothetical protein
LPRSDKRIVLVDKAAQRTKKSPRLNEVLCIINKNSFVHILSNLGHFLNFLLHRSDEVNFSPLLADSMLDFNELMKFSSTPTVGTRMYCFDPFSVASFLYSISNSTRVSECSETKATGTTIIILFFLASSLITSSVDGPIHLVAPLCFDSSIYNLNPLLINYQLKLLLCFQLVTDKDHLV